MKTVKTILYVDPDRHYVKRLQKAFERYGYRGVFSGNGKQGLDLLYEQKPDIAVLDYYLPDGTGEEFYTQFLMEPRFTTFRSIPFIALTNNGKVDKSRLYSLGFAGCFGKPFKPREFMEYLDDVAVTHRLKMEEVGFWETIHEAKDFLERVVESSVDSIITTDLKGIITYCNLATEELLRQGFDSIVGRRAGEYLEDGNSELLQIAAMLRKRGKVQNYKTLICNKNDEKIPINLSISTMKNGRGKAIGALIISKEIGGDNFMEYDSHASDRLATIVETAVAVNHAINNPLVPILGNAQFMLQSDKIKDEDIRKRLHIIVNNALRIRDITQKLARINHPVTKEYLRGTRMLDIDAST